MSISKTVGTLAHGAVSTAVSAARHPISTASMAAGLVKGTAEAGIGVVRGVVRHQSPTEAAPTSPEVQEEVQDEAEDTLAPDDDRAEPEAHSAPEAGGPREPEIVPKPVPTIDELPEPIVIEADDTPGEAFHTEPKVASRDAEHGGGPDDREDIEGYAEEIPARDVDIATPVGTTGAEVGHNPDTAESDLQQPQTPALFDEGTIHEVISESEQLRRAADPDKG